MTGTDTGAGKTLIACALLHALRAQGKTAIGMKPVATGCAETAEGLISEDAVLLQAASSKRHPMRTINPYAFAPAIAPHIAAAAAGVRIELDVIMGQYRQLAAAADAVVVEGVGGFRVPLNDKHDTGDLALALALPVVVVAGMRLGCLNHTLLTVEAIRARGLDVGGWIANQSAPGMAAFAENVGALKERIPAPCLGVFEFDRDVAPEAMATRLGLLKPWSVC